MASKKGTVPGTNIRDMRGEVFGRWTVISFAGHQLKGGTLRVHWLCRCVCGTEREVMHSTLTTGESRSCGCLQKERTSEVSKKHGFSHLRLYKRWAQMCRRCTDPNDIGYDNYGGRGITVCAEWIASYEQFAADMGEIPFAGATLERIDNALGYFPGNVRWATAKEQMNNRSTNHLITFNGKRQTVTQWAYELGMSKFALRSRLRKGWSVEKSLTTPVLSKPDKLISIRLTYDGRTLTLPQWARVLGLAPRTIRHRLLLGKSEADALTVPPHPRRQYITYNAITQTHAQWERAYGLKKGTIRDRLDRGWSIEDALTKPPHSWKRKAKT